MDTEANYIEDDEEDLEMIIERQGDALEDDEDQRPAGSDDEAQEAPTAKKKEKKDEKEDDGKKKRVLAPRPKLDPQRLMGPRGLLALEAEMKGVKLKGRGHEFDDLDLVMSKMQHWAHRLFPSYTFDDCLEKLEKLGSKKNVMVEMKKIRMGMISVEDVHDTTIRGNDYVEDREEEEPSFSTLMAQTRADSPPLAPSPPPAPAPSEITDEQRERMIRNRMIAEARKLERLKQRQEEERRIQEEESFFGGDLM
ncbi:TIMELESS-interacting protein [Neocloeon triangulifer]|uniref:TIMELESS-interacting protein n=1 Tax=Neocloeon triangulifer TaxID=2078957 RepID=UPI00286F8A83|nr:TIMELESS-interacting protein [Neocloeon triangulifer]